MLSVAGEVHGVERAGVYVAALVAGFVVDLVISTARESFALAIAPRLQGRVVALIWLVDSCLAPLGLLVALAAREAPIAILLVVPLVGLLLLLDRDRRERIEQSQHRLELVARERTRLQAAVKRLGDAFGAKLDLGALVELLLGGSIDALDADAGVLIHVGGAGPDVRRASGEAELEALANAACEVARATQATHQLNVSGVWALAVSVRVGAEGRGALAVVRRGRAFREDEEKLMLSLVERAQTASGQIVAHEVLRDQAFTDPLTRLGNRRKLSTDLARKLSENAERDPMLLMLFDLDGFKTYNDTFGHLAGDALLARLGHKLDSAVSPNGSAYRLGGDEFCVLLPAHREQLENAVAAAARALEEQGNTFSITASCGTVLLPHESSSPDYALQLADERMYARKQGRSSGAREQAQDVLVHIMRAKQSSLPEHADGVARLAVAVGRRLALGGEQLDLLVRAATLHDIGKVGLPDAILAKPGPLDLEEWRFVRQHTILGERILSAAPALRPVATIVRASHERWDGEGYPDGLRGEAIPLAARIIAACDAYHAITSERCYRAAQSPRAARDELRRQAGIQFDPQVVDALAAELEDPTADGFEIRAATAEEQHRELAAMVAAQVDELILGRVA